MFHGRRSAHRRLAAASASSCSRPQDWCNQTIKEDQAQPRPSTISAAWENRPSNRSLFLAGRLWPSEVVARHSSEMAPSGMVCRCLARWRCTLRLKRSRGCVVSCCMAGTNKRAAMDMDGLRNMKRDYTDDKEYIQETKARSAGKRKLNKKNCPGTAGCGQATPQLRRAEEDKLRHYKVRPHRPPAQTGETE